MEDVLLDSSASVHVNCLRVATHGLGVQRRRLSVGKTISAMQQKTELVCGLVFVGESDRLLRLIALEPTEGLRRLHVCWRVIAVVLRLSTGNRLVGDTV
jgi:hypothetical protein